MEAEYIIKRTGDPNEAEIFQSGQLVARLEKGREPLHALLKIEDGTNKSYQLDPRVDGIIAPFSLAILDGGKPELKIKSGCFSYRGKIYLFKSLPEGKSMRGHLHGTKYICRLDHLEYHTVDEIDRVTREKLMKHRGTDVGQLSGLGSLGHTVKLGGELSEIGLPLSAASYLLYSAG
jgi:hypothetical protein